MNQRDAIKLLRGLMNQHNLQDWKIRFNDRVSSAGLCSYSKKTIYLSKKFIKHADYDAIKNTCLHEIAHALDCKRRFRSDHSIHFQMICREIGCDYNQHSNRNDLFGDKYNKWNYTCQGCGKSIGTSRKLKNMDRRTCRKCGSKFTEKKLR